jgi:hypothetical protein
VSLFCRHCEELLRRSNPVIELKGLVADEAFSFDQVRRGAVKLCVIASLRANGSRERAPMTGSRETLQNGAKNWIASSQVLLAMTGQSGGDTRTTVIPA